MNDKRIRPGADIGHPLNRLQHMASRVGAKVRMYESGRTRVTFCDGDVLEYAYPEAAEVSLGSEMEARAFAARAARGEQ